MKVARAALYAATAMLVASPALAQDAASADAAPTATPPADATHDAAAEQFALFETYCIECHNFEEWAGGVAFDTMTADDIGVEAAVFEQAVRKLRGNLMPPPGNAQPDAAEVRSFISWMEGELDAHAAEHNAGYVPIHRLNRTEYAQAVKGLLGVEIDADTILPTEIEVEGFDNIAHALGTSPAFLDQYLGAARQAARMAVGDPTGKMTQVTYRDVGNQYAHLAGAPLGTRGGITETHNFPADGEYRFTLLDVDAGLYPRAFELETTLYMLVDGVEVFSTELGGPDDLELIDRGGADARAVIQDRVANIPVNLTAGVHEIAFTFLDRSRPLSDDSNSGGGGGGFGGGLRAPRLIDGFTIEGPFNSTGVSQTASREKIFVCMPETAADERPCAEDIARNLATRAFRRPATQADVDAVMPFYEASRGNGGNFDTGVEQIVTAILASPDFLYRTVTPPEDVDAPVFALDDLELASRLSFFLWSQNPDEQLIEIAAGDELSDPETMQAQVERMLQDPRAEALVRNFALQWLNLDELDSVDPDPARYPGFNDDMRENFATEIEMFLASILLEDRSVLDLMTADHTFVNEALARHYDIEGVYGPQFRRVTLENEARHGLLGKGAFQLRTSYGDRTSPVLRGAWVLEKLMGTPPTPPPPGVETDLTQNDGETPLTIRARLEQHRADASCNSCHGVIDPIGLALENFDVTGQWRDVDRFAGQPIDASTVLPNGVPVTGVIDLRNEMMKQPDRFAQAVTEKLMMYALGREVEAHDMPEVREILRDAKADDYRFSSLVMGVVNSDAFRMQARPEETAEAAEETQEAALNTSAAAQ
jgi:mono/diheme cytochrome c family protein